MILGIDTSNYTTSLALYDGKVCINKRKLLPVKEGEKGLRQSDALFWHIKQIPELFEDIRVNAADIKAVAASVAPRNVEGSYMPVFLAGESVASAVASTHNVPLFSFSHQEGHIMAGIYSSDAAELLYEPFLSVHLSGGTLEILKTEYKDNRFCCEIIGKTLDISAGQLIDRVGVDLGFSFPAGRFADDEAQKASTAIKLPVSVKKGNINFSGAETKAKTFYATNTKAEICRGVLECISKSIEAAVNNCINEYKLTKVLFAGGVASSAVIRTRLPDKVFGDVFFASAELSSDNAVGTAILGYNKLHNTK